MPRKPWDIAEEEAEAGDYWYEEYLARKLDAEAELTSIETLEQHADIQE